MSRHIENSFRSQLRLRQFSTSEHCVVHSVSLLRSGEFEQHDSLRLKQLLVYSRVTRDNSTVTFGGTIGGTVRLSHCDVLVFENSLQLQVVCTSQRQIPSDQIVQETVEIPQLQYIDNMVNISVVGIVQVSRVRVVTKTDEIPHSQCIDESINDSGVRTPQVLIVEKTVENSQLRLDMCL